MYAPLVYAWCRCRGFSQDAAEVIGQEVFASLVKSLSSFHKDDPNDSFRGWLRDITWKKCVDYIKSLAKQPVAPGGTDWHATMNEIAVDDDEQTSKETQFLYSRAIKLIQSEFNHVDASMFLEVVVNGKRTAEVATQFNVTSNMVFLAKSRILKRLREVFSNSLPRLKDDTNDDDLPPMTGPRFDGLRAV